MDMSFTLRDVNDERQDEIVTGSVRVEKDNLGLLIRVAGYGDHCSADGEGCPIILERHQGTLRLVIWGDINAEDPTHIINLEHAREDARLLTPDGELTVGQMRKYVERKGVCCPHCGSDQLRAGPYDTQDDAVFRAVRCETCEKEWTDELSLTSITE
jgi:hypothetical protein